MAILKLPREVALKIAAGEVVERPVSVVKEALENSLDAHSSRILVTLTEGGKSSIVVEDNGNGILWQEMPLVITRYATSKIATVNDLSNIKTLGYRGEAIASIAAVSRIDLRSKAKGAAEGGLLKAEGGQYCLS
jgi:DNA mismatch repair protein MutL